MYNKCCSGLGEGCQLMLESCCSFNQQPWGCPGKAQAPAPHESPGCTQGVQKCTLTLKDDNRARKAVPLAELKTDLKS